MQKQRAIGHQLNRVFCKCKHHQTSFLSLRIYAAAKASESTPRSKRGQGTPTKSAPRSPTEREPISPAAASQLGFLSRPFAQRQVYSNPLHAPLYLVLAAYALLQWAS